MKLRWRRRLVVIAVTVGVVQFAGGALAGPPFATDDPEPVDLGHWEVYGFTSGSGGRDDLGGILAGLEANYGAAPNLQLHLIVPLAFDKPQGGVLAAGLGDIEAGFKYRFITPGDDDWWPQVGTFPLVELPAGNAQRGIGAGLFREYLPIWLQKDWGAWTSYGGGGYWINPGTGNRDYWFAGWLLQRQVSKELTLGAELFHRTADTIGGRDTTGFNVGGIYDINPHYHLLFSGGRGVQDTQSVNQYSYYFALQSTF